MNDANRTPGDGITPAPLPEGSVTAATPAVLARAGHDSHNIPRQPRAPRQCGTCRFWKAFENQTPGRPAIGNCQRHAPIALANPPAKVASGECRPVITRWPVTTAIEGCGDWLEDEVGK